MGNTPRLAGSTPEATGNTPRLAKSTPEATGNIPRLAGSIPRGLASLRTSSGNARRIRICNRWDRAHFRLFLVKVSSVHVDPFARRLLIEYGSFCDRFGPL